jgi:hypothetical protein
MIQRILYSLTLIALFYALGWLTSWICWHQRMTNVPPQLLTKFVARTKFDPKITLRVDDASVDFVPGDVVDILALDDNRWSEIALNCIVVKATGAVYEFYLQPSDYDRVRTASFEKRPVRLQPTISPALPQVAHDLATETDP